MATSAGCTFLANLALVRFASAGVFADAAVAAVVLGIAGGLFRFGSDRVAVPEIQAS